MWLPCWAPRQKFPPPTTNASSTPLAFAAAISRARAVGAAGETPSPPSPARSSPDSLSSARRKALLAYGDAGEAADLDVLAQGRRDLLHEVTDGLLVVLDVGLLEQDRLGEELAQAPLDDLLGDGIGLALLEGLLAQGLALGGDDVLGHVLAAHVLGVRHRDVHGEVARQVLEHVVAGHEVGLGVDLDEHGQLAVVVHVGADHALLGLALGLLVG